MNKRFTFSLGSCSLRLNTSEFFNELLESLKTTKTAYDLGKETLNKMKRNLQEQKAIRENEIEKGIYFSIALTLKSNLIFLIWLMKNYRNY